MSMASSPWFALAFRFFSGECIFEEDDKELFADFEGELLAVRSFFFLASSVLSFSSLSPPFHLFSFIFTSPCSKGELKETCDVALTGL